MHLLFNIIAFFAGAIIGVVLTACIVAADWHEKPRRHRGWWIRKNGLVYCSKCSAVIGRYGHDAFGYCPFCGAKMKGVKQNKCEN